MRRPRRIFRSGSFAPARGGFEAVRATVVIGLGGALVGAAVVLMAAPATLFGRAPAVSGSISAEAQQVAVIDGDTLRLRETVIRLRGIVAPPRGRQCRQAHGPAFDCGVVAAEALAGLVRARTVACRLSGRDAKGFPEGLCESDGTDLNRALVAGGWAHADGDAGLAGEESQAHRQHRGLWRDDNGSF
jgi:endonuclease YncB( thermonuclease family)